MTAVPANWRVPLFWASVDASKAAQPSTPKRSLLMAPMLATGTSAADTPVKIVGGDDGAVAFGQGSVLDRMIKKYRANDPFGELWAIGITDAGVQSAGAYTFGGLATADGTISLYIGGQLVQVEVTDGDAPTAIALAAAAAIAADLDLPVDDGVPAVGLLPVTAKNGGLQGDDIDLRFNYYGAVGGEELPAGVTVVVTTPMAGGATAPVLTGAIAAMGDEPYDYWGHPWTDSATLVVIATEMDDTTGRWSALRQVYGHTVSTKYDTTGNLSTAIAMPGGRNNQHESVLGANLVPEPTYEFTAAVLGQVAPSASNLASQPFQTLELIGIKVPVVGPGRFDATERNVLLNDGVAQCVVTANDTWAIDRLETTYQQLPSGSSDTSMTDANTMFTIMEHVRRLKAAVEGNLGRHVLMADGARINANLPIATPNVARQLMISEYRKMMDEGLAQADSMDAFKSSLLVTMVGSTRLNVEYQPVLAGQLRVFDALMQFRTVTPVEA